MATVGSENPFRVYSMSGVSLGPSGTGFTCVVPGEVGVSVLETDGTETVLALTTDFTLSGATPETAGYNVTLARLPNSWTAWPAGAKLMIYRVTVKTQPYALSPTLDLSKTSLKARLDALVRLAQEAAAGLFRAVKVPWGETGPALPPIAERAGKVVGFDDAGKFDLSRTLASFDQDVADTKTYRDEAEQFDAAAAQHASYAETYRNQAAEALAAGQLLFDNISVAQLDAINPIITRTQEVTDALTDREISGLGAIDDARTAAVAAVGALQTAAQDAADAAEDTYNTFQAFYDANIVPLPARVAALESPLSITSFSVSPSVAEVGATATVTGNWTLPFNPSAQSIDQSIGAVSPVSARTKALLTTTANKTWTLSVSDGFVTRTAQASITFKYKRFWGVTTKAPGVAMSSAEIIALANSEFATGREKSGMTFDCTGGAYPVYAYLGSYGGPDEISVGGFASNDFTVDTMSFTNASGHTDTYNVLRLNTIQHGASIGIDA